MRSFLALLAFAAAPAFGTPIVSDTSLTDGIITHGIFGESFTTPSGGPWNNLTFNFFSDIPAVTPSAAGTAFLRTSEYLGDISTLVLSAPITQSKSIVGGKYVFDPTLTLQPNTQYWIYENDFLASSGGAGGISGEHGYTGGLSSNFAEIIGGQQTNFEVDGTVVGVPEPSTFAMLALALACGIVWRRRSTSKALSVRP